MSLDISSRSAIILLRFGRHQLNYTLPRAGPIIPIIPAMTRRVLLGVGAGSDWAGRTAVVVIVVVPGLGAGPVEVVELRICLQNVPSIRRHRVARSMDGFQTRSIEIKGVARTMF
jgi:hypothetical protein